MNEIQRHQEAPQLLQRLPQQSTYNQGQFDKNSFNITLTLALVLNKSLAGYMFARSTVSLFN